MRVIMAVIIQWAGRKFNVHGADRVSGRHNPDLVAESEILEGDGRRPEEHGAEERPETDHEEHGHPGIRHDGLNRDSTGSAMEGTREVQAGQADGVLDRHNGQLVPQREVLEHQGAAGSEHAEEACEDESDHAGHHRSDQPTVQR